MRHYHPYLDAVLFTATSLLTFGISVKTATSLKEINEVTRSAHSVFSRMEGTSHHPGEMDFLAILQSSILLSDAKFLSGDKGRNKLAKVSLDIIKLVDAAIKRLPPPPLPPGPLPD